MTATLAEQIEAVALGLERGGLWSPSPGAVSTGRKLREIAERIEATMLSYETSYACLTARIAELERQLRLNRDGWHKVPPYGYVPDEAQAPYIAGPVAEEGDER